jgi:hypothetical protein
VTVLARASSNLVNWTELEALGHICPRKKERNYKKIRKIKRERKKL